MSASRRSVCVETGSTFTLQAPSCRQSDDANEKRILTFGDELPGLGLNQMVPEQFTQAFVAWLDRQ